MTSAAAICLLLSPSAISSATSVSRRVSGDSCAARVLVPGAVPLRGGRGGGGLSCHSFDAGLKNLDKSKKRAYTKNKSINS
jgi:hypothetical protein